MKLIRRLSLGLAAGLALVVVLVLVALLPAVQTWAAQRLLDRQPGVQASLGALSAGFGKIELVDLYLKTDDAVLKLPGLEARLPLLAAACDRRLRVRHLVAKGWTLDLSGGADPKGAASGASEGGPAKAGGAPTTERRAEAAARTAERFFRGILRGGSFPCDMSLDGLDLEGDVRFAMPGRPTPFRAHVTIKGGGIAAGREASLAITAAAESEDEEILPTSPSLHGRLVVGMNAPRTVSHLGLVGQVAVPGCRLPEDLTWSADLAAAGADREETCTLELNRGIRKLLTVTAHLAPATGRLEGTWKVDGREGDLTFVRPGRALPAVAITGGGHFEADLPLMEARLGGHLHTVANGLGVLAPPVEKGGGLLLDVDFEGVQSGHLFRVESLNVGVGGIRRVAVVRARQPLHIDETSGALWAADPHADWLEGSIERLPLAWFAGLPQGITLQGADASGTFAVRVADGAVVLQTKIPLSARGVSMVQGQVLLMRGLDLTLALRAEQGAQGWRLQAAPCTIAGGGRRLAVVEASLSGPAEAGRPAALSGRWIADLEALQAQPIVPGRRWIRGRSVAGAFSASMGASTQVKGKLTCMGHEAGHTLTASLRAEVDAEGGMTFVAPIKLAVGAKASDVLVEGTRSSDRAGGQVYATLTGENMDLAHLGLLAEPLIEAPRGGRPAGFGAEGGPQPRVVGRRDLYPFWGDTAGRVKFSFAHLRMGERLLSDVAGTFDVDRTSLQLKNGRGWLLHRTAVKAEGALCFDACAEDPYRLQATGAVDPVDAATLFGEQKTGYEPVLEGRFAVSGTLSGSGINLADLATRTQGRFRLTSPSGILRLLKTDVGGSVSEKPTPVSDALVNVGSVVGALLGVKRDAIDSGGKAVSPTAEAVLNFTYQVAEIGYNELAITARRGADGAINLDEITIGAPNERLRGSGRIAFALDQPLVARPLSLDLQLATRGKPAELLAAAGLLSSRKDDLGYALVEPPLHFGGNLEQIDAGQWHDWLAEATKRASVRGPKAK